MAVQNSVIDAELELLESEHERLVQDFDNLQERILAVNAKIEVVKKLRSASTRDPKTPSPVTPSQNGQHVAQKPSDAVRAYLKANPGASRKNIIETVSKQQLDSKSENPVRIIYTTIWQLKENGGITEKNGGFWLKEVEE